MSKVAVLFGVLVIVVLFFIGLCPPDLSWFSFLEGQVLLTEKVVGERRNWFQRGRGGGGGVKTLVMTALLVFKKWEESLLPTPPERNWRERKEGGMGRGEHIRFATTAAVG